ncbi:Uncharacterised protein [Mycobacteroides abscessus subsp. abscessus]|nr:Uncharacterised protein [Mycobacteroides abscessus subsp. abscessus]
MRASVVAITPARNRSAHPCSSRTSALGCLYSSPMWASTSQASAKIAVTNTSCTAKLMVEASW